MIEINWNPSEKEKRQFVTIWLPAFFCVVGGVVFWKSRSLEAAAYIWGIGFVLSLAALLVPPLRRPLFVGWICAAFPIGWVMSHLILGAIFYLVLTPVGLLMRLFGRDPMQRAWDRSAKSYWIVHETGGDTARYFKQF